MNCSNQASPCVGCMRVKDPGDCENKNCKLWQRWFVHKWDQLRAYPRLRMDLEPPKPVGVHIAGRRYALPHQVKTYLENDPCQNCVCPRELCLTPCRNRRMWEKAKNEVRS